MESSFSGTVADQSAALPVRAQLELSIPEWWENRPAGVLEPISAADVQEAVREAIATGCALLPVGAGTRLNTGNAPRATKPYSLLSFSKLNALLDYQPDDLTVTCQPGMTLAALQAVLSERQQQLALDVPLSGRSTLGGIVSSNASGFLRASYGSPRDQLIGLRAITPYGEDIKGGGRVVKNVAGYDVCKLFCGGWGSVGALTELTFKVRPLPAQVVYLKWQRETITEAADAGFRLHLNQLALASIVATNELGGRAAILVRLEGPEERVAWQQAECAARLGPPEEADPSMVAQLLDAQACLTSSTPMAVSVAVPGASALSVVAALEHLGAAGITVLCGVGVVAAVFPSLRPDIGSQLAATVPSDANVRWRRIDAQLPSSVVSRWGHTRESSALNAALKRAIDPHDIFSPGRFADNL